MNNKNHGERSAPQKEMVLSGGFSLTPKTFDEAMSMAKLIADSDIVPKDYKGKPGNVIVAIQMGAELGLKPMQSLQSIAVINGRPALWGDGFLATVMASPSYEWHKEEQDPQGQWARCTTKRKGHDPYTVTFTVDMAKKAGLWEKKGQNGYPTPWCHHPMRMMQMRARSWACRDKFSDVLKGIQMAEEVEAIDISNDSDSHQPNDLMPKQKENPKPLPFPSLNAPAVPGNVPVEKEEESLSPEFKKSEGGEGLETESKKKSAPEKSTQRYPDLAPGEKSEFKGVIEKIFQGKDSEGNKRFRILISGLDFYTYLPNMALLAKEKVGRETTCLVTEGTDGFYVCEIK